MIKYDEYCENNIKEIILRYSKLIRKSSLLYLYNVQSMCLFVKWQPASEEASIVSEAVWLGVV